ncbi:MAG: hypothetical protein KC933_42505, partial [Myxococcales bacterium]|nr:hypothetical protein [Myxococcales bacterium]
HDALLALITEFQERRPHLRAVLSSDIDIQGHLFRYLGVLENERGEPVAGALDAGMCDADGRIQILLTFVGWAPPTPRTAAP